MNILTQFPNLLNQISSEISTELSALTSRIVAPITSQISAVDYATYIQSIEDSIRKTAVRLIAETLHKADEEFRNSKERTSRYYVKQTRQRSFVTIFGVVTFTRTEYTDRLASDNEKKNFCYVDEKIGLEPHQKYDHLIAAKAHELYSNQNSMIKVGELLGQIIHSIVSLDEVDPKLYAIPRQTIFNMLNRFNKIVAEEKAAEQTPETLFVMADEKYIHLQGESTKEKPHVKEMTKVAISFEGKEAISKKDGSPSSRFKLVNRHVFGNCNSEKLPFWPSFFDNLCQIYDMSKVKNIYILGDGGTWIKSGVPELRSADTTVKFALDRFHAAQAVVRMINDDIFKPLLLNYLYADKQDEFITVAQIARTYVDESKNKRFDENYNYIINNWKHFRTMIKEVKIGCPMEQAISHIVASQFSSVPKAYGRSHLPIYFNLRMHHENKRNVSLLYLRALDSRYKDEKIVYLKEEIDTSIFETKKQSQTYPLHLKNRKHSKLMTQF